MADVNLTTVNGNLTVIGAINTKHQVEIDSAAGVVVLSGNITNDGTTIPGAQAGVFISVGSGSLTTSGTITAVGDVSGGGGIQIQSYLSNSSVTINGALSTTGGGAIRLQAGNGSGINQMSVNAPVTTSGATAGEIIVYTNGGSVTLNQPVTLGTGGKIILSTGLSNLNEIKFAVSFIQNCEPDFFDSNNFTLLQCTSMYPIDYSEANLNVMHTLKTETGLNIGY